MPKRIKNKPKKRAEIGSERINVKENDFIESIKYASNVLIEPNPSSSSGMDSRKDPENIK
jgi:hypothetical protein